MPKRQLVVVLDWGSVTPLEIFSGVGPEIALTFVVGDSPYGRRLLPYLRDMGAVVEVGPDYGTLLRKVRSVEPDGITTFSDDMLELTSQLAHDLGLPHHSKTTAGYLIDKEAQRRRLAESGIDTVRHRTFSDVGEWRTAAAEVGFPLVVKPVQGYGSRNTFPVLDKESGERLVADLFIGSGHETRGLRFIAEELLVGKSMHPPFGDYVSVESIVQNGRVAHVAVTGKFPQKPPFREVGEIWPAPGTKEELDCYEQLSESAIHALGIHTGITQTELKLTESGPRIIEVNGRLGGWMVGMARQALGVDLVDIAARLALGDQAPAEFPAPRSVHFQYSSSAPTHAFRLDSVRGTQSVRAHPKVRAYVTFIRAGDQVPAGVGTRRFDLVRGVVDSHEEILTVVREAVAQLGFTLAVEDGLVDINALSLIDG